MAQLQPLPLGSIFVTSFDSQGYGTSSSYIATDSQSTSSSWCRAPFGADDQILNFFEWQLLSFFLSFFVFFFFFFSEERTGQ
jgi:hypothetical protein